MPLTERIFVHPAIIAGLVAYAKTQIPLNNLSEAQLIEVHGLIMHGEIALGHVADEPPKFGEYLNLLKQ